MINPGMALSCEVQGGEEGGNDKELRQYVIIGGNSNTKDKFLLNMVMTG
ncbi:hypothetical protein [Bacillus salipaludis]|uniref:Uncharacterized protein n=1 Tax=Bacillus salipaludis TaxID=2547811 RepID=A0ABW8RS68_9BACI